MWFSLDPPERPRRRGRPSHATIVAYLALIVAVAGGTGAAVAATVIHTRNIANGAVTNPKIANNAVGPAKIRNNAVTTPKIHNDAVGPAKIRNNAVTNPKIHNDAVTTAKIRDLAVTHPKIAHNAIAAHQIRDGAVTHPKIANNAVGTNNVRHAAITGHNIAAHTITGHNIMDHSLTGNQIDVSTLPLTGVAEHFTGTPVTISGFGTTIPLDNPTGLGAGVYSQPAHSRDIITGAFGVGLPPTATSGCAAGSAVLFRLFVNAFGAEHSGLAAAGMFTMPASNSDVGLGGNPVVAVDPTATTNPTSGPITQTLDAHVSAVCTDAAGGFTRPVDARLSGLSLWITRSRGAVHASGVGGS